MARRSSLDAAAMIVKMMQMAVMETIGKMRSNNSRLPARVTLRTQPTMNINASRKSAWWIKSKTKCESAAAPPII